MHWWIRPRVAVQSGMFCCGRSKGDEGPRTSEDSARAPPTPRPKRKQSEDLASSNRLLDKHERDADIDATLEPSEVHLLQPDTFESETIHETLPLTTDDSYSPPEESEELLTASDQPPQSEPLKEAPSESHSREGNQRGSGDAVIESQHVPKSQESPLRAADTSKELRRANSEEARADQSVTRSRDTKQFLRELSLPPRLQASEQRIQYHHDSPQQPFLNLTKQYQYQFQTEQQDRQRIQQQPPLQQQQKQQQPQQQQQYSKLRHPQNFSESFPSPPGVQQLQAPLYRYYYNQSNQWQQSSYYQHQNQQQQQQQQHLSIQRHANLEKQRQLLQHRRGHETTSPPPTAANFQERTSLQQKLASYDSARPRSISKSYSVQTTADTTGPLIGNHNTSSNVYANVRMSSSGSNIIGPAGLEMGIKSMEVEDESFVVETVEIIKRPGQTLGFYIREGNGFDRQDGVFISRIQMGTVAQTNGLLHVGDEIVTVNNVKVGSMSLDDVVILMSIPKKLVLTIRTRRNSSKNKSCPALPVVEKSDPPIVVLKKGRSSSASALEMTEKCPDLYEPGQTYSQYPLQSADYTPRRELSQDRQAQGGTSRYASIFISPQRAEAKLMNEEAIESSNSSEGSLPRSVDSSKDRVYVGQDVMDTPKPGYMSVTNPIYDHFSSLDYKHHLMPENMGRKAALPNSPTKQTPISAASQMHGFRSWSLQESSPCFSEPPYINVGVLREGSLQQHYPHHQTPSLYSHTHHQQRFSQPPHHYQFQPQSQHQGYSLHTQAHGSSYPLPPQTYRGDMPVSQEERKRQERLRTLLSSKTKYGRLLRSRSPECYNSDSELIFTHQQQMDARGFASDYETYGGAFSDDEPVYSIPRIPSSSSSELEMLLKKFTTLSQELQQEQSKLQRQLSTREKAGRSGQLPLSRAESLSGDEYGCQPVSGQASPVPIRRAASTQTPVLPSRLVRHASADTSPYLYSAYQHESHPDLTGRALSGTTSLSGALSMSIAGGLSLSTSQTSIQLGKQPDSSILSQRPSAGRLRDLQFTRKPLHIPYSEFEPYKADMKTRVELTRAGGLDGLLSIHIMSGQGLKSSKTSLRDLYCVVAVDSLNKARTMIRTGAINFDWDEAFDIDLEDSKEASFLIYHWDANYKHRLCFHGSVLLPGFVHSGHKRYVAIKLEPKGILFVTLLYKEPAVSLQRLPALKKNAMFGVDLETIILRESSGLNVPLLVFKCVQEVGRRGLDTVGIYRLCGSSRRKAILREAFENNVQGVDLSPDNVSDIHVITGVLKDFLRELPEPLFTNALYQMLLDALSVRLPCDPEGSAKLMLSILECLPSANQDTMALLLNHLRRVAAHSDKNKMPIDNLAICLGPVLLCPAPRSTLDQPLDFRKHFEVLRYLLEIWDYQGTTSVGEDKSPTADTIAYVDTGGSPQHSTQHSSPHTPHLGQHGSRRSSSDDITKFSAGDSGEMSGTAPRQ